VAHEARAQVIGMKVHLWSAGACSRFSRKGRSGKAGASSRTPNCLSLLLVALITGCATLRAAGLDAIVAADGTGQYRTIQEAISVAPHRTATEPRWTIFIKAGTYRERVYVQRERGYITLIGEDAERTILVYDQHANIPGPDGKPIGTFRTPTLQIDGDGFEVINLTISNSAGPVGQALALRADGDRLVFRRCRFLGWQDTILVNRGRHYFEDCYVEGHVDFIFGGATAFFSRCHVHCLRDGYITAASTPEGRAHGFVFADGKISGAPGAKTYLGRPWRPFARTIFLRTEMSDVVRPEGWHNWNKPEAEATAFYAEAENRGPGAAQSNSNRVQWRKSLSAEDVAALTPANVLGGADGWNPGIASSMSTLVSLPARSPWIADRGDGTYRNPILHADWSDPDAVRVGDEFWMTASSFSHVPGLPLLHSRDLVNWTLEGYALPRLVPEEPFAAPQHGKGVWAPSVRHHDGKYWIYYPDPDFGLYVVTATDPRGTWSAPVLVKAGKGLIDPCPLWTDDGRVYLVHAWAKSRAGINNVITLLRLSRDGLRVEEDLGVIINGDKLPNYRTLEGPKLYQRYGWFYVFAPAGGVKEGWQSVFRARDIRGPYEDRIVLEQGSSTINGPHQGALVDTPNGESWFLHFQDKDAYGRIVHLQPVIWRDGWPVMGNDPDGDGRGEPVLTHAKPTLPSQPPAEPATSDDFDGPALGRQWQWQANPGAAWFSLTAQPGSLRLVGQPRAQPNLYAAAHLLMQKFPAPEFTATTRLSAGAGARAGLIVFGYDYAWVGLENGRLVLKQSLKSNDGTAETEIAAAELGGNSVELRMRVTSGARCQFSYSPDGRGFNPLGPEFVATVGRWVGARLGMFCERVGDAPAHADFAWFSVTP
jgi:beta-xylosidase/pectin methylesterase-like acyl-CoA thioesterase